MLEFHLGIGHEDVKPCKHEPCQCKRNEAYHEFAQGSQQRIVFHVFQGGAHVDGQTAGHDQQQGDEQ